MYIDVIPVDVDTACQCQSVRVIANNIYHNILLKGKREGRATK